MVKMSPVSTKLKNVYEEFVYLVKGNFRQTVDSVNWGFVFFLKLHITNYGKRVMNWQRKCSSVYIQNLKRNMEILSPRQNFEK